MESREDLTLPEDAWSRRDEHQIRELIILAHWPMLKRVVGKIRQKLPAHVRVDEDDLRSYGLIGLYKALDRFDPSLGIAFDKFASNHVRGAVLDELRNQDWASRSLRKRQKDMHAAREEFVSRNHREPTDPELAEVLLWTVADINNTRRLLDVAWPRSLDEIRGTTDQDLYAVVAGAEGTPEEHVLTSHESPENDRSALLVERVALHIDAMPMQKKAVAVFCYFLDMRQSDVALVLGIPESRVSNLHLSVLDDIRQKLAEELQA